MIKIIKKIFNFIKFYLFKIKFNKKEFRVLCLTQKFFELNKLDDKSYKDILLETN